MKIVNEAGLATIAQQFAKRLRAGDIVFLHGELGAGKTTFVRYILRTLGFHDLVKSPSYTLVETYSLKKYIVYHFDLYRIAHSEELIHMGIGDYFTQNSVIFVEWPQYGGEELPSPTWQVHIDIMNLNSRRIQLVNCDESE